jgi:hypothetical protein
VQTQSNETDGQLSPDTRWMAHVSDESGQNGGHRADFDRWRRDAALAWRWQRDVLHLRRQEDDGRWCARNLRAQRAASRCSKPAHLPLFDVNLANPDSLPYQYDVTADGKRFLVNTSSDATASSPPLIVVVNWNGSGTK